MANHKSCLKRIRQNETRKAHNRYYAKTMRNALKKFRETKSKEEAIEMFPTLQKMLDKLAKQNIIHWKKAANLKSGAAKLIAKKA
jgi:small subunit ribosomal protein S20